MLDLRADLRQSRGDAKPRNVSWALPKRHTLGQRVRLFCLMLETTSGGSLSRVHRMTVVHDEAVIAFLLFCLEIYQAEQERKRKLH
jgi:hypothetical protein